MTRKQAIDPRASAHSGGPRAAVGGSIVTFLLLFGVLFAGLFYVLRSDSVIPGVGAFVDRSTRIQAAAAGALLNLCHEPVQRDGPLLRGDSFTCNVGEGCNGMSAIALVVAGLLAFPAGWRARLAGALLILPAVVAINVVRIAALYWTGRHFPDWFNAAHVYVGQVVVIAATAFLWWLWLAWNSRARGASA